jgi:hypothetical protein
MASPLGEGRGEGNWTCRGPWTRFGAFSPGICLTSMSSSRRRHPHPFPLYLPGDWFALGRSPPVPPRSAQQNWARLGPKGEGARQDSTARQTDTPQVRKTVGERGSSCRLSEAARTDERASSPHTPQGWAYQDQKSFAKGAHDPNS